MNQRTRIAPPPSEATPLREVPLATPAVAPKPQAVAVYAPSVTEKLYPPKIAKALLAVSRKLTPVEKLGFNDFHKYRYHKWEDVAEQLYPLIIEHGLIIEQQETQHEGLTTDMIAISYEFTIINEDGEVWPDRLPITAVCKVRDGKGVLDDKAASKCHTQAAKYAYVSLFKIRIQDAADADANPKAPPPIRKRAVPSPDGHVAPHHIASVEGETPKSWTEKLIPFLKKAKSQDERDQWDALNSKLIDLVQDRDVGLYNQIVAALNPDGGEVVETKKADPISSATKPAAQSTVTAQEIPIGLDRKLTDPERDWLTSIEEAYALCNDMEEIASEQDTHMMPAQDRVSAYAWKRASDLTDYHIERVNEGGK